MAGNIRIKEDVQELEGPKVELMREPKENEIPPSKRPKSEGNKDKNLQELPI